MKKHGISPEHEYITSPGTFNMVEQKMFMGSKMMYIDDYIKLENDDIIFYNQSNGEQLDLSDEKNIGYNIYNTSNDKYTNHKIEINNPDAELTEFKITINIISILSNYIYSNIKQSRSFENVLNINTSENSVNNSIYNYISNNILERYTFDKIKLYLKYISLKDSDRNKHSYLYNININNTDNIFTNYKIDLKDDILDIYLNQEKPSSEYTFDYYFDLYFKRK